MRKKFFAMLSSGRVEEALLSVAVDNNNAKLVLADYRNEKRLLEEGLITPGEFAEYKQKLLNRIPNLRTAPPEAGEEQAQRPSVFLSYNQYDYPVVLKLIESMEKNGIHVRIDKSDVMAGESISDFIVKQTKDNNAVMVLLSKNSLRSGWVIYESTMAIFNALLNNKPVLPVALDEAYLDDQLAFEIISLFDEEIRSKRIIARQYEDKGASAEAVYKKIERLIDARNQLPKVLSKLADIAVYPVSESDLEHSIQRIASYLSGSYVRRT